MDFPKNGILWFDFDDDLGEVIARVFEESGFFSRVVDSDTVVEGRRELAVLHTSSEGVFGLAIVTTGPKQALRQRRVRFSHFHPLSISYEQMESVWDEEKNYTPPYFGGNPARIKGTKLDRVFNDLQGFDKGTTRGVKSVLSTIDVQNKRFARGGVSEIEVLERDAVCCALEIFGSDAARKQMLSNVGGKKRSKAAPFLSQLKTANVREDTIVFQDSQVFPGFRRESSNIAGIVEHVSGSERLTIVSCNRCVAEEALGVDLIYYSHEFDSFVMIQYKCMRKGDGKEHVYRPSSDKSLIHELNAMQETKSKLSKKKDSTAKGFRLYDDPFFFKLCKADAIDPLSTKMSHGIYIPHAIWKETCRVAKGPKGGTALSWDNCPRKLLRVDFVNGVRNGWLGSSPDSSAVLATILETALAGKRLVVCATTSPSNQTEESDRDDLGRYTTKNDPLATN